MLPSSTASTRCSLPAVRESWSDNVYFWIALVGLTTISFMPPSLVISVSAIPSPRYLSLSSVPSGLNGSTAIDLTPARDATLVFASLRFGRMLQRKTTTAATARRPANWAFQLSLDLLRYEVDTARGE